MRIDTAIQEEKNQQKRRQIHIYLKSLKSDSAIGWNENAAISSDFCSRIFDSWNFLSNQQICKLFLYSLSCQIEMDGLIKNFRLVGNLIWKPT